MSAFFSKVFTLFLPKIAENAMFATRKLDSALTLNENAVPWLRNFVAFQLNQKAHGESCVAASEIKKIKSRILRCAFTVLFEKIDALCCAALLIWCYLCPPLLFSRSWLSNFETFTLMSRASSSYEVAQATQRCEVIIKRISKQREGAQSFTFKSLSVLEREKSYS